MSPGRHAGFRILPQRELPTDQLAVSGLDLLRDLPKLIYPGRGQSTTRGWKLLLDIVQLAGHLGQFVPKAKRGAAPYDLVELVLDACELLANPAQIDQ